MRVLLTGASGQLGAYLIDALARRGHEVVAWSGSTAGMRGAVTLEAVDLADVNALARRLEERQPEAVLHAAAVSNAEAVRLDPGRARTINTEATARIAAWCARRRRRLVFTSTDLVFDGSRAWNREEDAAEPILEYGRTKRAAEPFVSEAPRGLVARLSLLYGPSRCGRAAFFDRALEALRNGERRTYFEDEYRTPLDLASAAEILVRLVEGEATGIVHVAGRERVSRYEMMRRCAAALGYDTDLIGANRQSDVTLVEPRPADVSMDTGRLAQLVPDVDRPAIEEAIAKFRIPKL